MTIRLCALACGCFLFSCLALSPFARAEDPLQPVRLRIEAEMAEVQRSGEEKQRFRVKMEQLNDRSAYLRAEGRFEEAQRIDAEIRDMLRNHDPQLQRANELKRRALRARLEAQHEDADLFEREANRLLKAVTKRYAPPASEGPPAEAENSGLGEGDLREEVTRLAQQVEALTKIVEKLLDQRKP